MCDFAECSRRLGHARDRLAVTTRGELTCQLPAATLDRNHGRPERAAAASSPAPRAGRRDGPAPDAGRQRRRPRRPTTTAPDARRARRPHRPVRRRHHPASRRLGRPRRSSRPGSWSLFARQVGDAQAASEPAPSSSPPTTPPSSDEVQSLQGEARPDRPSAVRRRSRRAAHGLGSPREIPFTLDPSVAGAGRRRARLGVGPARRRDRPPDAARVLAVAPLRPVRLTHPAGRDPRRGRRCAPHSGRGAHRRWIRQAALGSPTDGEAANGPSAGHDDRRRRSTRDERGELVPRQSPGP